ncbi:MAG: alpha/beta hydrolase family protein [Caldivirga sp.]|uniref:alpha/beta hydrolase family protein n=1 Tax=Caldivirga sp. TaxID=2080243 RepID=UPI003D0BEE6D
MRCVESPSVINLNDGWIFNIVDKPEDDGKHPAVIMFHGFTGTHIEAGRLYVDIARELCSSGFVVVRFDYRNHGDSSGPFEEFDIDNALNDAEFMVNHTLKLSFVDSSKIALLGLSMGGYITLKTYAKMRSVPKALILLSPAIDFSGLNRGITQGARGDYFYFGAYRLKLSNALKLANSNAMDVAELIKVPIMIIHSKDDSAVPYQQSVEFHDRVKFSDKTLILLDKSGHTFDDYEVRRDIIRRMATWLKVHLS